MKKYISHLSALKIWNFPLAHSYFEQEISAITQTQYTVLNRADRFMLNGQTAHICTQDIPSNGLCIKHGVGIVSPHLMFIQLAKQFDIFQTIILGNLLCSRPDGAFASQQITKSELLDFVIQAKGHHGQRRAYQALRYVKDNAFSVMEIFVDLFLGLPMCMGGLGLKGGVFNCEIILDYESSQAIKKDRCFIDYCFPEPKIGYEYQSEYHNQTIDQDSSRSMALSRMNYRITTITKSQLYDKNKLKQLLFYAAKIHKIKYQIRTPNYEKNLNRIRQLLPRFPNRII